jgi:hypothetical protein
MGLWDQSKLIDLPILKLLVLDIGPDRFLVSSDRRNKIAACPEFVPGEILRLAFDVLCNPDRTLTFDEADDLRDGVFGRNRNQHMDVIGHQMPFLDPAFATPRQIVKYGAKVLLDLPEDCPFAIFRNENHMIFALPCGMASGDAAASLGSPCGGLRFPGEILLSYSPKC